MHRDRYFLIPQKKRRNIPRAPRPYPLMHRGLISAQCLTGKIRTRT